MFVAPWVEEACKATIIFAIAWWRRHDFNGVIAGVVYGGLTGIGFAFTENIVYYGQIFQHVHDLEQRQRRRRSERCRACSCGEASRLPSSIRCSR